MSGKLIFFKAEDDLLQRRLTRRNERGYEDANQLPVTQELLRTFIDRFEEPANEGEEVLET